MNGRKLTENQHILKYLLTLCCHLAYCLCLLKGNMTTIGDLFYIHFVSERKKRKRKRKMHSGLRFLTAYWLVGQQKTNFFEVHYHGFLSSR